MIQDWSTITLEALQSTWQGLLLFLPKLIGSLLIFVIGWFIALGVGRLVAEILKQLRFNQIFERTGWKQAFEKAELKANPSDFVGAVFKWILVIVFLLASVEILGFVQFADFIQRIIDWLPNLIVAVAIFVVAIILTDIFEKVIKAGIKKIDIGYTELIGTTVRWAIYIFAGLAILLQLGVTPSLINTMIQGFVWMIALAFGLAFGLGGKDTASKIVEDLSKRISEK
ncbi:MAG: hypothetical protein KJI71_05685 [Patescibacteria group bacterium]|nr:hypothetical protein [Patescibacteria group bacterium]